MIRFVFSLLLLCMALAPVARADDEIGYVEDFTGLPSGYLVKRGDDTIPMQLCMPIHSGDTIEALSDKGRVSLRLVDHPDPVIWSRADRQRRISAEVPQDSYVSSLMSKTLAALSPFDQQKRERVLTVIRGDEGEFGVPLLQGHQTVAAGQRMLSLGWMKSSAVTEISITAKSGQKLVVKSKGTGGLWTSPRIDLKPGQYHILVTAGPETVSGNLEAADPSAIPQPPAELMRNDIPESLRRTAQAVWLAEQDNGRYRLEALQLIANDRSRPARVLTDALIGGKAMEAPK